MHARGKAACARPVRPGAAAPGPECDLRRGATRVQALLRAKVVSGDPPFLPFIYHTLPLYILAHIRSGIITAILNDNTTTLHPYTVFSHLTLTKTNSVAFEYS